jgi:phosphoribosylaminoimidazolecarboxamide formyltransferase/IMP cyclohydrolase
MVIGEEREPNVPMKDIRRVDGGILYQDADRNSDLRDEMKVATKLSPTEDQWEDLLFAWRVVKHVKSNAIVLAKHHTTLGVGAGQMSRVDSTNLAIEKTPKKSLLGCVLSSDAYFPFRDCIDLAAKAGVKAIIQPGGSIRDEEVIKACDEQGIAMVFTGKRHFKH